MEKLETLIQELYQDGTREKNMEVLSHIRKLAKEKKQFIIPVGDAEGEKVYRRLSLDDGQDVFVAFTTQVQVDLGQATETLNQSVMDVLHMVHDTQGVSGVVLNPWKDSYFLPKVLIEMILDNKNLESEIKVVKGDITTFDGDCIVNAANESLLGGGGVDGAIHRAAGPMLLEECKLLNGCQTGQAKITKGYDLKAKYVIHTVGPIYSGQHEDEHMLRDCYWNSLSLARKYDIHTIAFPAISCGVYGYPVEKAVPLVLKTIADWLDANSDYTMKISLYCFDEETTKEYQKYTSYQGE
ncbi:O-acetyl-ADP-ribose deacetylase [Holdemanella biformis]|uniref:O-acetyl-ADP-ribose deacetylase n=1 Tax=Holdemanella biformis TaxID=1735 RepID=UPI00266C2701|nr:O-acetyl-ADP-ribose deacetylase [Holdemanella biformis]